MARHALIIAAGAADAPLAELDGRTPLEAAVTPALDRITASGRQGTIRTIPPGFAATRDVATLGLAGYDVRERYCGYAGMEALGRRVYLADGEVVFRCNLMTLADGVVTDVTAGRLPTDDARRLVEALNAGLGDRGVRFHTGQSYRALLVAPRAWDAVICTPDLDMVGQPMASHWPDGRGSGEIRELIVAAGDILSSHEVNRRRRERGERPANGIWPWGQGVLPRVRRFRERFGVRVAAIGAVDLFRGVGLLLGWHVLDVSGATGSVDTDYAAKGRAAVAAVEEYELVVVHVEAPYEASLAGDATAKVRAVEQIDRHIVGPMLERVSRWGQWGVAFTADIAARTDLRTHAAEPVPFCLAGSATPAADERLGFGEANAARSDLHIERGHDFMEYFLRA
jgi:2,3-bisphosphoglycerate-independent phosphoglycerate mutase